MHGISRVATISCYICYSSYIYSVTPPESAEYELKDFDFFYIKYDATENLNSFIFSGKIEYGIFALGLSAAHLVTGLIVLPSRSFKAHLFSPILSLCGLYG